MKKRILSVLIALVMLIGLVTVMGISASAAGTHSHCICGETHASVGDHTTEQSVEWTAWNGTDAIPYDADTKTAYVYLSANAERTSTLDVATGYTLNLCLNGHKITPAQSFTNGKAVTVNGTFILTDCGTDGAITGFTNDGYGAGVHANNGCFIMYGGTISNNQSTYMGGGVLNQECFIMYGGTICGNQAEEGGGVYNWGDAYIYGGTIENNTADVNGGGLYHYEWYSSLLLSGNPTISGNKVNGVANNVYLEKAFTIDKNFAPATATPIGITMPSFGCFAEAADGADIENIAVYEQYFVSDIDITVPVYKGGDALYIGYKITEQPDAENGYTVKTNDDENAKYQWYSAETDEVPVTYDFLVEQDTGFDLMYNGNFDSQTNKWEPVGFSGGFGYLFVALDAGETFIAEFDSALPAGYVALLGGWDNDNGIQATQQNGNIYTFKATEAGIYVLVVAEGDEEPVALSEAVIPKAVCQMDALIYTPLDGQNEATLDITGLESGAYICKTAWDIYDTPEYPEDDYYCISAPVTLQYYDVIFDYGTLGSKTVSILEDKMITAETPEFAGHIFMGWFTDATYQTAFDFDTPITATTTVYAKFADYEGDKEALQGAIDALEDDVKELNKLIEADGTIDQINDKITEIQNKINSLDDTYATDAEVADAIAKAKEDVKTAYTEAINKAVADLETKIAAQIDPTELAAEIKNVTDLVDALDDTYATDAEVADAIAMAKEDVKTAYTEAINKAVADLEIKIAAQIDPDELAAEIKNVTDLIDALDDTYATDQQVADAIGKAESELAKAKSDLETLIGGVQSNLDKAKAELDKTIADLDAAVKAGDKELSDKIAAVNTALADAKAALEKADTDNKTALVSKIKTADATLDAAIKAVQKNLDDAKAELDAAIKNGDIALDEKIANLNTALEAAKAALEATDAANKAELEAAMSDVYNSITDAYKKAIDKAQAELEARINANVDVTAEELAKNTDAAQTIAITATAVGGTALISNIALIAWALIKKKRLF